MENLRLTSIFITIIILSSTPGVQSAPPTAKHWFTIDLTLNSRETFSATVAGNNQQYIVFSLGKDFEAYEVDWEIKPSTGPATYRHEKTFDVIPADSANLEEETLIQSDGSNNVVAASKTLIRANTKPGGPSNPTEYPVTRGVSYSYPVFGEGTSFMFVATSNAIANQGKLYRVYSDRVTDVVEFGIKYNSKAYGVIDGTPYLLISLDRTSSRGLYDYTNLSSASQSQSLHSKESDLVDEVGFISPDGGRNVYVVTGAPLARSTPPRLWMVLKKAKL